MSPEIALAQLQQVAAATRLVAVGPYPGVQLGTDATPQYLATLAKLPAAEVRKTLYDHGDQAKQSPYVIESVTVYVDGVRFEAQLSRPATLPEVHRGVVDGQVSSSVYRMVAL